ncbi:MAG: hypothetical protein QNJ90_15765 [Planctomycetota bacterium]|nr:hypothetical protein [Planctomycetota bacterium]
MKTADECFICQGLDRAVARSEDGRAVVMPFRDPFFEGHVVVAPATHTDTIDVDPATWSAMGTLIPDAIRGASDEDTAKCYLLALGDVDTGHLHFHVVPKKNGDVSLGQYVFGPEGWNVSR